MSRDPVRNRYLLSRQGRMFALATLLILVAAYGLGMSVLYLFGAMFIGTLIYNGLLAIGSLHKLKVAIRTPSPLFARQAGELVVDLTNRARFIHASHLRVSVMDPELKGQTAMVEQVPAGQQVACNTRFTPPHRGWVTLDCVGVETSHPFGLATHGKQFQLARRILVYPALLEDDAALRNAKEIIHSRQPRSSDDFQYLDAYRPGDDVRLIHWRKSTLAQQPVIRRDLSSEKLALPRLFIPDACPYFEHAVRVLATHFWYHGNEESWWIYTGQGLVEADGVEAMLTILATIQAVPSISEDIDTGTFQPLWASDLPPKT